MDMNMDPQNHDLIEKTINSNLRLLEAAARQSSSVKSVVITSSLAACALPTTGVPYTIDPTTWNVKAIAQTSNNVVVEDETSKALGEQESFAWVHKHAPLPFSFNTVVPNVNFGMAISPPNMGYRSTAAVLDAVVKGYPAAPSILPSRWYVDVEDTALLHLAALTRDDMYDERLLAFAGRYSWTQILEILHRRFPGRIGLKALPLDGSEVVDAGQVDNRRSIQVLKMTGKKEGFTSLEDMLVKAMDTIFENQGKNMPKTRIDLYYESLAR
ncbi:NAD dependent epimerase/dehydratase, putative [Talaromyces marneffei ATCC 18224]|uniref:NAD dependent epimerase/dehydratase, putative n=1 Tax=Talaromyces marneffei (strain ATCC 18224 / CBS 334.59 / QM 7333) TaxID=441960 RepID=B6QLC9_TALMQ|nr:NAD dependent epimerase/dehydratase, putative [Talaromyces marneffei ATCC 18224]